MTIKSFFIFLWKLLLSSLTFVVGMMLGGMLATLLTLPAPILPPEIDAGGTMVIMFATSPLLVLALYFVNRALAGGWLMRGAMLAWLAWIAYSVNNVIEAAIFTSFGATPAFTLVNFAPALLLCAFAVAMLFRPHSPQTALGSVWRTYFHSRSPVDWVWRLALAAVVFMPIYYGFGLLVVPLVGDYYLQGSFGLAQPPLGTLLLVLLVRSVLFFLATLPIVVSWQETRFSLVFSLGFALFVMVGLLYMLAAAWIAPEVRFVHSLEILADSFVYAGVLAWLLARRPAVQINTGQAAMSQP